MRLPTLRHIVTHTFRALGLLFLLCVSVPIVAAEESRGVIMFRDDVPQARRLELAQELRSITGWPDLEFDQNGVLKPGSAATLDGSQSARALISGTLNGDKVVILEDASNRADVVFAKVIAGRWQNNTEQRPVFVVQLDFADFDHLMGDKPALEAFNVGWGVMHEIDHVTNDSLDADILGHVGQCETHINQMRRECHLPARLDYFFNFFPTTAQSDFRTRLVRLAFEQTDGSKKHRRVWVIWDAAQVGGLDNSKQVAAVR